MLSTASSYQIVRSLRQGMDYQWTHRRQLSHSEIRRIWIYRICCWQAQSEDLSRLLIERSWHQWSDYQKTHNRQLSHSEITKNWDHQDLGSLVLGPQQLIATNWPRTNWLQTKWRRLAENGDHKNIYCPQSHLAQSLTFWQNPVTKSRSVCLQSVCRG